MSFFYSYLLWIVRLRKTATSATNKDKERRILFIIICPFFIHYLLRIIRLRRTVTSATNKDKEGIILFIIICPLFYSIFVTGSQTEKNYHVWNKIKIKIAKRLYMMSFFGWSWLRGTVWTSGKKKIAKGAQHNHTNITKISHMRNLMQNGIDCNRSEALVSFSLSFSLMRRT